MAAEPEFDVVWPVGARPTASSAAAARLSDLNGRKVAFVWDYIFRGDEMFELIKADLRRRFPSVEFVDHAAFGNIHGAHELEELEALPERLAEHEVDAAVVGVGA